MLGFYGGKGLAESFFLKLSAHQCAILDQVVLSDVARGSSTESARATLLRRGNADFGVSCADRTRLVVRFYRLQPMERDQDETAPTLASI